MAERLPIGDEASWYRHLAETAEDVILVHDMTGKVLYLNKAGMRLGGYEESVVGKSVLDVLDPGALEVARERMAARLSGDRRVFRYETSFRNKAGKTVPVEVITNPLVEDGEIVGVLVIGRDVAERKKAETERAHLEESLRRAQKLEALGRLAGGVAHDFNNALTVISGYAQILLESLDEADPLWKASSAIKRSAANAERLTDQLLTFGRRSTQSPEALSLNDVLRTSEDVLARVAGNDARLVLAQGKALRRVKADPAQIEQVLYNLVANARDAMPEGGTITVATSNTVLDAEGCRSRPGAAPGPYVVLSVHDTGIGMTDDVLEHIFEPLFTTKEGQGGTGLGLATVYGVVRQSGGFVDVESRPGVGSTFLVYLPVTDEEVSLTAPAPPVKARGAPLTPRSGTILLADDDDLVRGLARDVLAEAGFRVIEANGAGEAFLLFRKHADEVRILVTDVVMPRVSGVELHQALVELRPDLPVLYVSGHPESVRDTTSPVPDDAYLLRKPFEAEALVAAVDRVLAAEEADKTP